MGDVILGPLSSVFYGAVRAGIFMKSGWGRARTSRTMRSFTWPMSTAPILAPGAQSGTRRSSMRARSGRMPDRHGRDRARWRGDRGAEHCRGESLVPQRFKCPPGSMVYGSPAKVIRPLTEAEQQGSSLGRRNMSQWPRPTRAKQALAFQRKEGIAPIGVGSVSAAISRWKCLASRGNEWSRPLRREPTSGTGGLLPGGPSPPDRRVRRRRRKFRREALGLASASAVQPRSSVRLTCGRS